jgi:acyl-ACP thioesterase
MDEPVVREYSRTLRIPIYEVGAERTLKLGSVLRLAQETSEQHLDLLRVGYERLREDGLVFFIISSLVKVRRLPEHGEEITIRTHPRGRGGVQFYRDFIFYSGGEQILSVMQTTVMADAATHRVRRPQNLMRYGVFSDEPVPKEEQVERCEVPEDLPHAGERRVSHSDLDLNGHMNNTVYGDIVTDFLPAGVLEKGFREVQITYYKECREGDVLEIRAGTAASGVLLRGSCGGACSFTARVVPR